MLGDGHQGKKEKLKESQLKTMPLALSDFISNETMFRPNIDLAIKVASVCGTNGMGMSYAPTQLTNVDNKDPVITSTVTSFNM